jgi:hypothetical protein
MAHAPAASLSAVVLLAVIVGVAIFYLPLSPMLSITFTIGHTPNYPSQPALTLVTWSYSKISLAAGASATKGEIRMSFATNVTQTPYTVGITITYGGKDISVPSYFSPYGEGTYQAQVVYWPMTEEKTIPYVITLTLYENNQKVAFLIASIYPT